MASKKKKADPKFDPFAAQKISAKAAVEIAKATAGNTKAVANMVKGAVTRKGGQSMAAGTKPKSLDTPKTSLMGMMVAPKPYSPGVVPSYPKKPYVAPLPEKTRNENAPVKKSAPQKKAAPKKKGGGKNIPVWKF